MVAHFNEREECACTSGQAPQRIRESIATSRSLHEESILLRSDSMMALAMLTQTCETLVRTQNAYSPKVNPVLGYLGRSIRSPHFHHHVFVIAFKRTFITEDLAIMGALGKLVSDLVSV